MPHPALDLARWATELAPTSDDLALAGSALGHVLDVDDLHMPSTAHVSVVCVPATLAAGGGAGAHLAGAGVAGGLGQVRDGRRQGRPARSSGHGERVEPRPVRKCAPDLADDLLGTGWEDAAELLRRALAVGRAAEQTTSRRSA